MEFIIFTKPDCIWCKRAKELLREHKLYFEEYIYLEDFTKEYLLKQLGLPENSKLTLPQVFLKNEVGITSIGGFTELSRYINKMTEI